MSLFGYVYWKLWGITIKWSINEECLYCLYILDADKEKNIVIFDDSDDDLDMDLVKTGENKENGEISPENSEKNINKKEIDKNEAKDKAEIEKSRQNTDASSKKPESNNQEEALKAQQTLVDFLKVYADFMLSC